MTSPDGCRAAPMRPFRNENSAANGEASPPERQRPKTAHRPEDALDRRRTRDAVHKRSIADPLRYDAMLRFHRLQSTLATLSGLMLLVGVSACDLTRDPPQDEPFSAVVNGERIDGVTEAYETGGRSGPRSSIVVTGVRYHADDASTSANANSVGSRYPSHVVTVRLDADRFDGVGSYAIRAGDGRYARLIGGDVLGISAVTQDETGVLQVTEFDPETRRMVGRFAFTATGERGSVTVRDAQFNGILRARAPDGR